MSKQTNWTVFSSHGAMLFLVAATKDQTAKDLADTLYITLRTARSLLADLRRAGLVKASRRGRFLYYRANMDAPFDHAVLEGFVLRDLFGRVAARRRPRIRQA